MKVFVKVIFILTMIVLFISLDLANNITKKEDRNTSALTSIHLNELHFLNAISGNNIQSKETAIETREEVNEELNLDANNEMKNQLTDIDFKLKKNEHNIITDQEASVDFKHLLSDEGYQDIEGILTFRGNNLRNKTSIGRLTKQAKSIERDWIARTGFSPQWDGGSGWTGQPLVTTWEKESLQHLGVYDHFKKEEKLQEVIQVSLDGSIYFFELDSGDATREPIKLGNPIKGTPALDPRGYPLLVVGEGIPEVNEIGMSFVNLLTNEVIYKTEGIDPYALRKWGAFDGSPLISKETDTLVTNGENGLIYKMKLNSKYDPEKGEFSINPDVVKMQYQRPGETPGVESSIVAFRDYLFVADNHGTIQGIDTNSMETIWAADSYDDTDSTMLLNEEKGKLFLYTASEIDLQGAEGEAKIRKLNASNGKLEWELNIPGYSIVGSHPINGGFLASPLLGEGKNEGQIIFNMARYGNVDAGLLFSLDTETGQEVWRFELDNYAWSSPVGTLDEDDNFYIVQSDSVGNVFLINGDGDLLDSVNVDYNIEASPIIVDNRVIVGSRGREINSFIIK